jgi:hypothetical protein
MRGCGRPWSAGQMAKRIIAALVIVAFLQCLFVLCLRPGPGRGRSGRAARRCRAAAPRTGAAAGRFPGVAAQRIHLGGGPHRRRGRRRHGFRHVRLSQSCPGTRRVAAGRGLRTDFGPFPAGLRCLPVRPGPVRCRYGLLLLAAPGAAERRPSCVSRVLTAYRAGSSAAIEGVEAAAKASDLSHRLHLSRQLTYGPAPGEGIADNRPAPVRSGCSPS